MPPGIPTRLLEYLRTPWVVVMAAFGYRLFYIFQHHLDDLPTAFNHMLFGYEVGRIASSVASGHGFSSPFPGWSGPTAWLGPVYPLLLAAVFKIFGAYSHSSAVAILTINCVFAALTGLTIYLIGKELFGRTVGLYSAWAWALIPYFVAWSSWIWETSLATLLLSLAFLITLRLERNPQLRTWIWWGFLWGFIALTNAAALSFLAVSALWLWWRLRRTRPLSRLAFAGLVFVAVVSPWVVRNYVVFDKFVFPRSDFGEELYMGNHEGSEGLCMFWDHPVWNTYEMARFSQIGELAYVAEKGTIARQWIAANPGRFAVLTLKRVGFFWFDIPEQGRMAKRFGMGSRHALFFGFALLSFWGLGVAFRERHYAAPLFAGLFLVYPLVYYITHSHPRYQHPITPEMLLLSVYLLVVAAYQPTRLPRKRLPGFQATNATAKSAPRGESLTAKVPQR